MAQTALNFLDAERFYDYTKKELKFAQGLLCFQQQMNELTSLPKSNVTRTKNFFWKVYTLKVVILAGGFGTRIGEETQFIPKPMIEIGGEPILWHIMKLYSYWGYNEFIICGGYKQHIIKEFFAKYVLHHSDVTFDFRSEGTVKIHKNFSEPWQVTVINTGYNTLTAGRIKKIQPYTMGETFLLTYGDGLCTVNINELIKFHETHGKICTITAVQPEGRFGAITLDDDKVLSFREKSKADVPFINGGYMVMRPEIFDYIEGNFMLEQEPFNKLIADDELRAYKYEGFWQCMDTVRDKRRLESLWQTKSAPWKLWEDKI